MQQINVKNVQPVYSAGIWTHDLRNMSLLPYPLDQGSGQLSFNIVYNNVLFCGQC